MYRCWPAVSWGAADARVSMGETWGGQGVAICASVVHGGSLWTCRRKLCPRSEFVTVRQCGVRSGYAEAEPYALLEPSAVPAGPAVGMVELPRHQDGASVEAIRLPNVILWFGLDGHELRSEAGEMGVIRPLVSLESDPGDSSRRRPPSQSVPKPTASMRRRPTSIPPPPRAADLP
jgi:hypothetical protein